jgi:hypothetical protein
MLVQNLIFGKLYEVTEGSLKGCVVRFVKIKSRHRDYNEALFFNKTKDYYVSFPYHDTICLKEITPVEEELWG